MFDAINCDYLSAEGAADALGDCLTHDVRVFVRRGRGGAKGRGYVVDE